MWSKACYWQNIVITYRVVNYEGNTFQFPTAYTLPILQQKTFTLLHFKVRSFCCCFLELANLNHMTIQNQKCK